MDSLFNNPGGTIQKIAKNCVLVCAILAAMFLVFGFFLWLSSGHSIGTMMTLTIEDFWDGLYGRSYTDGYVSGYIAQMMIKGVPLSALAAIFCISLYAFGSLVDDVIACKALLIVMKKAEEKNVEEKKEDNA